MGGGKIKEHLQFDTELQRPFTGAKLAQEWINNVFYVDKKEKVA